MNTPATGSGKFEVEHNCEEQNFLHRFFGRENNVINVAELRPFLVEDSPTSQASPLQKVTEAGKSVSFHFLQLTVRFSSGPLRSHFPSSEILFVFKSKFSPPHSLREKTKSLR